MVSVCAWGEVFGVSRAKLGGFFGVMIGVWTSCREVFFFSACFSRGIRDDIEEEDDQVSETTSLPLLCL